MGAVIAATLELEQNWTFLPNFKALRAFLFFRLALGRVYFITMVRGSDAGHVSPLAHLPPRPGVVTNMGEVLARYHYPL